MGTTSQQKLLFTFFLCSSIFFLLTTASSYKYTSELPVKLSKIVLILSHRRKTFHVLMIDCVLGVRSSSNHHHHGHGHSHGLGPKKLFVFGDSYADTGNNRKSIGSSWKVPYGITFPGKPAGRFSDGRVFTDFLARFVGLRSPLPYRWRKYRPHDLKYGMNFAYGGTGVFDTGAPYPNMTTQIDLFEELLKESVFSPMDLQNSLVLVTLSGNDYSAYLARNGSFQGLPNFITQVVNQLALNLERIYSLGVKKIAVTGLQPLGCLPRFTAPTSYQQCNSTDNKGVNFHNLLLQQAVAKINNQTHDHHHASPITIIDLYDAFFSVLNQGARQGSSMFNNPLKPCCMGTSQNSSCGSVDAQGNKLYTVCQKPKSSFFWDNVHPTEAGWNAVYLTLQDNLGEVLHNFS